MLREKIIDQRTSPISLGKQKNMSQPSTHD
jgi:hypothetical protein